MPPKRKRAATQRLAEQKRSKASKEKNKAASSSKATPPRRITRSTSKNIQAQALRPNSASPSRKTTRSTSRNIQEQGLRPNSVQPAPASTTPPRTKRERESEERPDKQRREGATPVTELPRSKDLLTWLNLERLNSETAFETSDDMVGQKQTRVSQLSSLTELEPGTASKSSPLSTLLLARYRLGPLDDAGIYIQHEGIPEHLEHRVNAILQAQPDKEMERVVFSVVDNLRRMFPRVLNAASREDDSVELVAHALVQMNLNIFDCVFNLGRKADWDRSLAPKIRQRTFSTLPPDEVLNATDAFNDRSNELNPPDTPCASPRPPRIASSPPHSPPLLKQSRPDITIGYWSDNITKRMALLSGVRNVDAKNILTDLHLEEGLGFENSGTAPRTCFPSLVVEGKSYATGRSMYEAENQAAQSGTSMLIMQSRLARLSESHSPGTLPAKEPLAFSVTQEGPVLLLWVHYITSDEDTKSYNMHVLRVCHATIPETTRAFFMALAGVMKWASTELLDHVVAQLAAICKAIQKKPHTPGSQATPNEDDGEVDNDEHSV